MKRVAKKKTEKITTEENVYAWAFENTTNFNYADLILSGRAFFFYPLVYFCCTANIKKPIFFISITVIIKSITIQTLYLNSMWLPPHSSPLAFLNQMLFIVFSAMTAFNFVMAAVLGPSYLPYGWKPKNKKHESILQLCTVCPETYKAPRAHHCRKCDRCVAKMVSFLGGSFDYIWCDLTKL